MLYGITLGVYLSSKKNAALSFQYMGEFRKNGGAVLSGELEFDVYSSSDFNKKTYTFPEHKISPLLGAMVAGGGHGGIGIALMGGVKYRYRIINLFALTVSAKVLFIESLSPFVTLGIQLN
jgi:hypothetical protein